MTRKEKFRHYLRRHLWRGGLELDTPRCPVCGKRLLVLRGRGDAWSKEVWGACEHVSQVLVK